MPCRGEEQTVDMLERYLADVSFTASEHDLYISQAAKICHLLTRAEVFRMILRLGGTFKDMSTMMRITPRVSCKGIHSLDIAGEVDVVRTVVLSRLKPASSGRCFPYAVNGVSSSTVLGGQKGRNYRLYRVCTISTWATNLGRVRVERLYDTTRLDIGEEVKQAIVQYMEETLKVERKLAIEIIIKSPHYVDYLLEEVKSSFKPGANLNLLVRDLLTKSKFKGVEPYLESIGFTPQEIGKVSVYSRSGVTGVIAKVNLMKSIGIKPDEIPRVVTINPRSLSNALCSQEVKVRYLRELGLSFEDIRKLVVAYPKALSFGLKNGRLPLVDFLRSKGVNDSEIGKVVVRCPQLLTLNVEKKLQPAIEILESVAITGTNLSRVLVTQPSLLRRRLKKNIEYCRSLGLDQKPGVIARLLVTCPNFSEEGCKARMSYLESLGLTKEQVVTMIIKNPAWLSFNVESSLSVKVNYLVNVMGRSVQELVTASTYLTMSLENRIVPRWTVLSAMEKAGLLTKTYSLSTLVTWSDVYFEKHFVAKCPKGIKRLWFAPLLAKEKVLPKD